MWVEPIGGWGLHLTAAPVPARADKLTGLFGDFDGDKSNDLVTSGGEVIGQPPSFDKLYRSYTESWRVTDNSSLFDYDTGQSTATFTDRAFPDRSLTVVDLPAGQRDAARQACELLGVSNPDLLDACIVDIALTGLAAFAASASDIQVTVPAGTSVDGPPIGVSVTQPGGTARVTYAGTAGQRVYVQVLSSTLPDQCGVVILLGPDDKFLANGCIIGGVGQIDGTVLPVTGQYAVVVDPAGDSVGQTQLRIVSSIDQATPSLWTVRRSRPTSRSPAVWSR